MSDAVDVLNGVIATKDAEIERLKDDLANMYRLRRECVALTGQLRRQAEIDTAALNKYKALADDLAADLANHLRYVPDSLARWRKARGR